jgi:hypothetical protein
MRIPCGADHVSTIDNAWTIYEGRSKLEDAGAMFPRRIHELPRHPGVMPKVCKYLILCQIII